MKKNKWSDNPNLYISGCVLQAYGTNFDPVLFLTDSTFDPRLVIFKGKLDFPEALINQVAQVDPSSSEEFKHTHLILRISKSEKSTIQLEEVALFLRDYRSEVLRLSSFPNIEHLLLQFKGLKDEPQKKLSRDFENLAFVSGIKGIFW